MEGSLFPSPRPLRCLIVDDDSVSRMMLEELARQTDAIELVGSCPGPVAALGILQREKIDVIFLDVEMPEMTGLELIRILETRPEIILVTARQEYAVDAFDVEVADYLLKPVTLPRFLKAVNRILERRKRGARVETEEVARDSVYVRIRSQLVKIPTADILWVESNGDYVTIQTERESAVVHSTMKEMEGRLSAGSFLRVHRSYIVQLAKIKAIEDTVIIIGNTLIPIGDKYRTALMNRLNLL